MQIAYAKSLTARATQARQFRIGMSLDGYPAQRSWSLSMIAITKLMRGKRIYPGAKLANWIIRFCALLSAVVPSATFAEEIVMPAELSRSGDTVIMSLVVQGVQVYECKRSEGKLQWIYTGPRAPLMKDGQVIGRFFTGPTWQLNDGSSLTGGVVAAKPAPSEKDYPWQRFDVVSKGQGAFTGATSIVQIDTHAGMLQGECIEVATVAGEPYAATYVFLKSGKPQ